MYVDVNMDPRPFDTCLDGSCRIHGADDDRVGYSDTCLDGACRIHGADVLRTFYAILTRGGVLQAVRASEHHVRGVL